MYKNRTIFKSQIFCNKFIINKKRKKYIPLINYLIHSY